MYRRRVCIDIQHAARYRFLQLNTPPCTSCRAKPRGARADDALHPAGERDAPEVGLAGHLKIGDRGTVGAQSGVMHDIPEGERWLAQARFDLAAAAHNAAE